MKTMERIPMERQQSFTETDPVESNPEITYTAKEVSSFSRGVEEIILSSDRNSVDESPFGKNSVCFVDVDGVLIENTLTQYPGVCHLFEHNISEEVQESLKQLVSSLGQDAVSITTNRDERVKVLWSSDKILDTVQGVLDEIGFPTVKIFTNLNKQVPNFAKKKRERLVDHYVNYIKEKDIKESLKINVIQDLGIIGLDRRVFPKEIAEKIQLKVKEELSRDIGIDIVDYVLKK
jgi:hypothetical protein